VGLGTVPLADWLVIGYLIVFATALGQQAWLYGVQGIGPSRAGVFVNLVPVSALVLSALLLGEQIDSLRWQALSWCWQASGWSTANRRVPQRLE